MQLIRENRSQFLAGSADAWRLRARHRRMHGSDELSVGFLVLRPNELHGARQAFSMMMARMRFIERVLVNKGRGWV